LSYFIIEDIFDLQILIIFDYLIIVKSSSKLVLSVTH